MTGLPENVSDTIARNAVLFDRQRTSLKTLKDLIASLDKQIDEALEVEEFDLDKQFTGVLLVLIPALGWNAATKALTDTMEEVTKHLKMQREAS